MGLELPYFTEEHRMLREMVSEFAANEIVPVAAELDHTGEFPATLVQQMADLDLMGVPIPEEYGGAGMDTVAYALVVHELAIADASVAITLAAHTSLGTMPILLFGSEEQKRKYLPLLAKGEILGALGLTEPGAGSDAGATQTRAELKGDRYIINGQKAFITNGGTAGVMAFTARLYEKGEDQGITVFLTDTDTPGLRTGKPEKKMGWRASDTRAIYFEDMELTADNVLGVPGQGFRQVIQALAGGRISVGALALGTADGAYRLARSYAHEREAFGRTIDRFQAIQFMLSDIATSLTAASHLVYHAAWLKDQGQSAVKEAAMAKLFASEVAMRSTSDAIQIHGGYGYIREYNVERYFRDAKILEIGEGTSEIQRIIIAREIMKEAERV